MKRPNRITPLALLCWIAAAAVSCGQLQRQHVPLYMQTNEISDVSELAFAEPAYLSAGTNLVPDVDNQPFHRRGSHNGAAAYVSANGDWWLSWNGAAWALDADKTYAAACWTGDATILGAYTPTAATGTVTVAAWSNAVSPTAIHAGDVKRWNDTRLRTVALNDQEGSLTSNLQFYVGIMSFGTTQLLGTVQLDPTTFGWDGTNLYAIGSYATNVLWSMISGIPATFPPSAGDYSIITNPPWIPTNAASINIGASVGPALGTVRASTETSYGVFGWAAENYGVYGTADSDYGVYGQATSDYGVYGTASGYYGVYGEAVFAYGGYFTAPVSSLVAVATGAGPAIAAKGGGIELGGTTIDEWADIGTASRYQVVTNATYSTWVTASGPGITASLIGATLSLSIPADVVLLSIDATWPGNVTTVFQIETGRDSFPAFSIYRLDTGAYISTGSVTIDVAGTNSFIAAGLWPGGNNRCVFSF